MFVRRNIDYDYLMLQHHSFICEVLYFNSYVINLVAPNYSYYDIFPFKRKCCNIWSFPEFLRIFS